MSVVQPSDDELVRRSLAGEAGAFAQLVEKHQRLVFGVALSGARDAAAAEDVAQEAFVEAWRDLPRLRDPARVGSWIAGIARNLARSWHRHTARRSQHETTAIAAPQPAVPTPLDRALDRETQSLVGGALARIPAAYREVLVLYYVQGRSVAEVASGLGISEDLARQRLSRGRRALRESLETHVEGALEQLGPSKAFTAAVVAAVGTTTARKAVAGGTAAGKVFVGMKASKLVVIGVAVVIAGGIAWYERSSPSSNPPQRRSADAVPTAAGASNDRGEHTRSVTVRKLPGREPREQLLQAIHSAQQQRLAVAAHAAASPPAQPSRTEALHTQSSTTDDNDSSDPDEDYIQGAMTGLLPLIVDCYKQARTTHPDLAGTLVVNFTIEGEPGIGGLVTESTVDSNHSEIKDPALSECVQETMFALEIDPPSNGGTVHVTYPFTFRPKN